MLKKLENWRMVEMKIRNLVVKGVFVVLSLVLIAGCASSNLDSNDFERGNTQGKKETVIGITQIAEHPALDNAREGFKEAILELSKDDNIVFIERNAQGDIATAQIIAEGFKKDKVDMIYAIATPSAQAAFNIIRDIPIMISAVTDPVAAGIVESLEKPNTNVSGTSDMAPIGKQLELLLDLNINPKTIGFIYNTSEKNSEVQLQILKKEADILGISVEPLGITSISEIEKGIDVLLNRVDVLYTPADNLIASSIRFLTSKANEKKIPVIGAEIAHVESGALATLGVDYFGLGKQTGHMAHRVLEGESILDMPIEIASNPSISINIKTAKILGLIIDESLLAKSKLIGDN